MEGSQKRGKWEFSGSWNCKTIWMGNYIYIYFIYIKHIYDIYSLKIKKFIQSLLNEQHYCLIGSLLQPFLIKYLLPTLRLVLWEIKKDAITNGGYIPFNDTRLAHVSWEKQ